jgi:hypothetical protein
MNIYSRRGLMGCDGTRMGLRNVGILPYYYTASQPRRPLLAFPIVASHNDRLKLLMRGVELGKIIQSL